MRLTNVVRGWSLKRLQMSLCMPDTCQTLCTRHCAQHSAQHCTLYSTWYCIAEHVKLYTPQCATVLSTILLYLQQNFKTSTSHRAVSARQNILQVTALHSTIYKTALCKATLKCTASNYSLVCHAALYFTICIHCTE